MRTAVIFHRLGPYHFARLRAAGKLLAVTAIETSGADETYKWDLIAGADGFERVTLFAGADAQKLPAREVASRVGSALDTVQPSVVVIPGWADSAALGALAWSVKHGVPVVCMSESTAWDSKRRAWSEALKRRIVGLCSAALAGGHPHKDYLVQLGMPAERVFLGYDAVDNGYFAANAEKLKTETLKSEMGSARGPRAVTGVSMGTSLETQAVAPGTAQPAAGTAALPKPESQKENTKTLKTEKLKGDGFQVSAFQDVSVSAFNSSLYFLASARFIEKKNLARLIEAYARYREKAEKLKPETLKSDDGRRTTDNGPSDVRCQTSEVAEQDAEKLKPETPKSDNQEGKTETTLPPISAFQNVSVSDFSPWPLVLLGDGELRPALCSQLPALGLHEHVQMPGFKQYPELPEYYARAGAFIHASTTEQWGLVVNEAMASGLPVLVSNRCGCATDLVQDGINGFTFDPYNVEQMADLMFQVSGFQPSRLSAFGEASRRIIADWGPERFASGLKGAVEKALEIGPMKPSLVQRLILRALLAR